MSRREQITKELLVEPGTEANIAGRDPAWTGGPEFEELSETELSHTAKALLADGVKVLAKAQERLWASDTNALLVVFQALDAAGKDSTIKHVMSGVNPQGVQVVSFKQPSSEELGHDFLWRTSRALPERGRIGIFNRSHYEEVLVVRVHPEHLLRQRLPRSTRGADIWDRRYREINDWERYLTGNGLAVVKLFLNLSKEEQRVRFLKRIDVPERNWKFSAADVRERRRWDDYQEVFSEMLSATSTEWAPWYVVPADRKWFARICAAAVLAHTLTEIDPQYPTVSDEVRTNLRVAREELEQEAPDGVAADPYLATRNGHKAKKGKKARV
jgi:PPK2 family polyphosphate:nucleotide phosphotransferase